MKKITSLQVQKRNPNRVNVFLDGEFAFGLSRIVAAWLKTGQELSEDNIAELKSRDAAEVALQRAMNFLSYRPRSEKEVTDNLRKHDTPDTVIDQVLERLKSGGLVNDLQFARQWLENRSEFRPRGRIALRTELRQKGVPNSIIEQVLEGLNESDLALRAGRSKAGRWKNLDEKAFKQKLYGYLSRRGFTYEVIPETVQALYEETRQK